MLKLINAFFTILLIFSCYCSPVESNDDKCGKDLKLVKKFFEFLYNDKEIKDEFKSILLNKYSLFLTKRANKKARKSRKTKENLIEENDKNDSPKSTEASSSKLLNKEVGNNEGKNKEQMEPQKAQTFTELLNENDDDNEAGHLPEDRNNLDLDGRTGWISPESSSKRANDSDLDGRKGLISPESSSKQAHDNIDDYNEVEPTPEGDVDLAFEAHKAQILEELFRDTDNHKEAEHIPEPAQENSKKVEVVDLTSLPSSPNQSPNQLPDNATNGAFYFYQLS